MRAANGACRGASLLVLQWNRTSGKLAARGCHGSLHKELPTQSRNRCCDKPELDAELTHCKPVPMPCTALK